MQDSINIVKAMQDQCTMPVPNDNNIVYQLMCSEIGCAPVCLTVVLRNIFCELNSAIGHGNKQMVIEQMATDFE